MLQIPSLLYKILTVYLLIQMLQIADCDLRVLLTIFVWLFHLAVWAFVLLGFLNKRMAALNVYYIIPGMYLLHMLPFHVLETIKGSLMKNNKEAKEQMQKKIAALFIIPDIFMKLKDKLQEMCFFNPMSAQGMLLFGMITGILTLYPNMPKYNLQ